MLFTTKLIPATILLLLASPCGAQDLFSKAGWFSKYEPLEMNQLQRILPTSTVGQYPILQVGDEWQYLLSKVSNSTGVSIPIGRIAAIAVRGKAHFALLRMRANLSGADMGNWTNDPCKRVNFLWKRSTGGKFADVNCASINHVTNYLGVSKNQGNPLSALLGDEGIEFPPTVIRVTFTRFSDGGRLLGYAVAVNPESYGIARDSTKTWRSNGWHKNHLQRFPERASFIARLSKWAEAVQDRMDRAFVKDSDAFVGLPTLDDFLRGEKIESNVPSSKGDKGNR